MERVMRRLLPVVVMVGFLLSSYAYYVEQRFARAQELGLTYRAYCDAGVFSCTRVFASEYGALTQLLGLPRVSNAALGMLYYLTELVACRQPALLFMMSAASCIASVGLFFVLTVILHDLCVVCCSTYIVNLITCFGAWRLWKQARAEKQPGTTRGVKQQEQKTE
ncbi:vitamin-K-epoxide reductase (warfarin-sensitive) [Trypanosoma grayi]|uniref:vitamin-K-epoxide reductase (warfarin-sensitive) n=1 Tax=Trypanosoma grayi TaxID=71804 RepID=UPI0004F455BB|nr:vitamin-K-epoxide reductase (warfarin-sensitive) [Trypanosoma grayi]KEG06354.1 vitamin-K-epoxide reductase (warfarin-sensitive) [Trypanosoma grayi]